MRVKISRSLGQLVWRRVPDRKMPLHRETRIVPYTAERMYAVVADVEHYPEFLPWCSKVIVRKREKDGDIEFVTAEMVVSYRAFHESYVSRVTLDFPALTIEARHIEGPFRRLDTRWRFIPLKRGSEVHFLIDFAFSNPILSAVAGAAFGLVAAKMQQAFIDRATMVYGEDRMAASSI